jgi:uncharacterized Zn finger protein (UPF0148 family)
VRSYFCPSCKAEWELAEEREDDFAPHPLDPFKRDESRHYVRVLCPNCGSSGQLMTPEEEAVSETAGLPAPDMTTALRDRAEDLRQEGR